MESMVGFFVFFLTREEITFCEVSTSGKFTWPKRNHFDLNHWVIMAAEWVARVFPVRNGKKGSEVIQNQGFFPIGYGI